jgi:RhtB (resistance to homoserine/threonine) family protein
VNLGLHDLPLFALAALLVNLTPGPDMLFVVGNAAARGRRAGVMAALGVGAGCMVHIAMAAVGLSALLAASATAFTLVKWVGAAYLVWMGISMLRPQVSRPRRPVEAASSSRVFWQGALTNALNPKVALFFLAFLPQFIESGTPNQGWAFVALGLLFNVGGTLVNVIAAWLASGLRDGLEARGNASRVGPWLQRAAGGLFVALGLKLALGSR